MNDPVDTDALRAVSERLAAVPVKGTMQQRMTVVRAQVELTAAADEVDRLRSDAESGWKAAARWERTAADVKQAADVFLSERDTLRAAMENAPHGNMCETLRWAGTRWESGPGSCTCWKAGIA